MQLLFIPPDTGGTCTMDKEHESLVNQFAFKRTFPFFLGLGPELACEKTLLAWPVTRLILVRFGIEKY
jgi:hypothetical protein